ncbi:MAG: hypothetical protein JNM27_11035 [Leptospirales bacterium]|nr:hypothetical protein [Leptospirales bacterium]
MQISGKHLLSSAETLLRERRDDRAQSRRETGGRSSESGAFVQPAALHGRLMQIQGNLAGMQNEFSREQARLAYLADPEAIAQEKPVFDGKPLFPESDLTGLKDTVLARMDVLRKNLRTLQVEMENLVALGAPTPDSTLDARALLSRGGLNHVDPERVSRLTRS